MDSIEYKIPGHVVSDESSRVIHDLDKAVRVLAVARQLLPAHLSAVQSVRVGQVWSLLSQELVLLGAGE